MKILLLFKELIFVTSESYRYAESVRAFKLEWLKNTLYKWMSRPAPLDLDLH